MSSVSYQTKISLNYLAYLQTLTDHGKDSQVKELFINYLVRVLQYLLLHSSLYVPVISRYTVHYLGNYIAYFDYVLCIFIEIKFKSPRGGIKYRLYYRPIYTYILYNMPTIGYI
jgi:hypothetical protein